MLDRKDKPASAETTVGAYEAKTKFSELIARAEKGESFVVTKNGRPVARIDPIEDVRRLAEARAAGERILERMDARGLVSDQEAQRNWEEIKRELDLEDDEREKQWLSSSTPR
jgi:prevent-host-death family protein